MLNGLILKIAGAAPVPLTYLINLKIPYLRTVLLSIPLNKLPGLPEGPPPPPPIPGLVELLCSGDPGGIEA